MMEADSIIRGEAPCRTSSAYFPSAPARCWRSFSSSCWCSGTSRTSRRRSTPSCATYPVIGRLRYFFEQLGEYFRQYFFTGDRDEMPFNRATRGWVYRLAKNEGGIIGFGSTYDLHEPGALIFVNAPFPVLEDEDRCRRRR
jgi:hypothetical protein